MKNGFYKSNLSDEQFAFVKANKQMTAIVMAKVLNVKIGALTHARWIIRQVEAPEPDKRFFDIESYSKTLKTI